MVGPQAGRQTSAKLTKREAKEARRMKWLLKVGGGETKGPPGGRLAGLTRQPAKMGTSAGVFSSAYFANVASVPSPIRLA